MNKILPLLIFIFFLVLFPNSYAQESSFVSTGHYGQGTTSIIIVSGSGHVHTILGPGPNVSGVSYPLYIIIMGAVE